MCICNCVKLLAKNTPVAISDKNKHLSFTDIQFLVQTNWLSAIKPDRKLIDERTHIIYIYSYNLLILQKTYFGSQVISKLFCCLI